MNNGHPKDTARSSCSPATHGCAQARDLVDDECVLDLVRIEASRLDSLVPLSGVLSSPDESLVSDPEARPSDEDPDDPAVK